MEHIVNTFRGPAFFMGQFICVMSQEQKRQGEEAFCDFAESSSRDFKAVMANTGLIDLGVSGNPFT